MEREAVQAWILSVVVRRGWASPKLKGPPCLAGRFACLVLPFHGVWENRLAGARSVSRRSCWPTPLPWVSSCRRGVPLDETFQAVGRVVEKKGWGGDHVHEARWG